MAYIERVEVENEGFLGGLDVTLEPGLNVLIGARGTGKTSVIELIRYALNADSFTTEAGTKGQQQAVATLDGGAVTVTVRDGDSRWAITRTAEGATMSAAASALSATVLAQNEVESIGVSPSGRLALIDRFLEDPRAISNEIRASADIVIALTNDISTALDELDKTDEALSGMGTVTAQLNEARVLQESLLARSSATVSDQQALTDAQARLSRLAQRESQLAYASSAIEALQAESASMRVRVSELSRDLSNVLADSQSVSFSSRAEMLLSEVSAQFELASAAIKREANEVARDRADLDTTSRTVRQRLDLAQDGLSQATRRVQQFEEIKGQLDALQARRVEYAKRLAVMRERRRDAYEKLAGQRSARLLARQQVADRLSRQLAPQIRVRVSSGQRMDSYVSGIIASLRGSGLHYNNLAPLLATSVSPFELVDWAERSAADELVEAVGMPIDRAASVVNAVRQGGAATIIASDVEDEVSLELLDGPDYKPIEHLSIGQRCTVILPILLALEDATLVVDQPEDHLDNAFIASTLIASIRKRGNGGQTIFSSHNANIPVLGEASLVIVMDSDGASGRVRAIGGLDEPRIVEAISEIMEGGAEAFAARAQFYSGTGSLN
jgi:energy-coupling factor transporter ATP-binding protein EcfA2